MVRAPRGAQLNAQSWQTEGPLRMLMNNLDPEVAERPEELVVYGGRGKAARDWPSFDRIVAELKTLADDETLLVQSGKPVGIVLTHEDAPRVLIANSNLVGQMGDARAFRRARAQGSDDVRPDDRGFVDLYRLAGHHRRHVRDFIEAGRQHYGGDLAGRWILSAGLGGMGGAQPLAAVMAGCLHAGRRMPGRPHRAAHRRRLSRSHDGASLDEALALDRRSRPR